ncbi:MAG: transglutaminase-like domain-containing protein [Spirochaetaceae bacterium]|jgi:transglutaminase-like putative cysteine protease|nr:transglutaminase-like domain-containing protein [Spirochaetaceae bacterium]
MKNKKKAASTALAGLLAAVTVVLAAALVFGACKKGAGSAAGGAAEVTRKGIVTYDFELQTAPDAKHAVLFTPVPLSDANQDISELTFNGNYSRCSIKENAAKKTTYLAAEWDNITETPKLSFSFHVDSHYKKGDALQDGGADIPADVKPYLEANMYIPCEDKTITADAAEAAANAATLLDKARGVYDWTISHTFRDPDVKGCGLGRAIETLTEARGGGKCADISSVFVTVLRAAGVPARDVFGLRTGGKDGEISGDFHCWTEFYLPGRGWVQADPADVRKAMLLEKLELGDAKTKEWTEFFWNGDNLFRIALNRGDRGMVFDPAQQGEPLEYFMYPFAQVDGKTLDYFSPNEFKYKVSFKGSME